MNENVISTSGIAIDVEGNAIRFTPVDRLSYGLVFEEAMAKPNFIRFDVHNGSSGLAEDRIGYLDVYFNGSGMYSFVDMQYLSSIGKYYAKPEYKSLPMPVEMAYLKLKEMLLKIANDAAKKHLKNCRDIESGKLKPEIDREWEILDQPLNGRVN